jgi:ERCC4-type nuclease
MLIIDDREHGLCTSLKSRDIKHTVRRLVIADILVTEIDESVVTLAIERKTVNDLRSSLRDGRFAEQRSRMVDNYGTERCVYIIEGKCENSELGVLMSLQFRDRITVIKTVDVDDTVCVIDKLSALAEEGRIGARDSPPEAFAKVKKVPTSDPKSALGAFLSIIPGVSRKMALCIAEHFDGPGNLCERIQDSDGLSVTRDIKFGNRKVGPSIAQKILDAFKA